MNKVRITVLRKQVRKVPIYRYKLSPTPVLDYTGEPVKDRNGDLVYSNKQSYQRTDEIIRVLECVRYHRVFRGNDTAFREWQKNNVIRSDDIIQTKHPVHKQHKRHLGRFMADDFAPAPVILPCVPAGSFGRG